MLRINTLLATLLFVMASSFQLANAQEMEVTVQEHIYDNIHLVSYPATTEASRGGSNIDVKNYDFEVFPGGDVSEIHFSYEGCEVVEVLANGTLRIEGAGGESVESLPYAYQEMSDGEIVEVAVNFVVNGNNVYLQADQYELMQVLTIEMKSARKITTQHNPSPYMIEETQSFESTLLSYAGR